MIIITLIIEIIILAQSNVSYNFFYVDKERQLAKY